MPPYKKVKSLKDNKDSISKVFKIIDEANGKYYAMKVITGIDTSLYRVIFEREINALTLLRSCKNIVRMEHYDVSETENLGKCGIIFLEFVEGRNLSEIDVDDLSIPDKYNIVKQLIYAISTAHENRIIHRDINPRNIMITESLEVKLIDFGISKIKDMVNKDSVYQFATNNYSAPEVHINSENATEKSDIYSLGCVIFYLFTGEEPSTPDEFIDNLRDTLGIDNELKKIILKMVSPDNGYDNVFDIEKDLSKVIKRFIKSEFKYSFNISTGKFDYLKSKSLVNSSKTYDQLMKEDLFENFLESYAAVKNENTDEEVITVYGINFLMECVYEKDDQQFHILKFAKLHQSEREKIRRKYLYIDGDILFKLVNQNSVENNNFELYNKILAHKAYEISSENIDKEYALNYSAWHRFLDVLEEAAKENIKKIEYSAYNRDGDFGLFEISQEMYLILDDISKGTVFVYELNQNGKSKPIEIGTFEEALIDEGSKYYLKIRLSSNVNSITLKRSSELCVDYRREIALIRKQKDAIISFRNEEYNSSSNLKGILSGVTSPNTFVRPKKIQLFNTKLDSSQQQAVKKALYAKEFAVIQGPPGTGKTNVIVEIIRQVINENIEVNSCEKKILIASQAHSAVDNMLEDLQSGIPAGINIVRIGRDEDLSETVKNKYAVDYIKDKWKKDVIKRSNEFSTQLLIEYGIEQSEFENYYNAKLKSTASNTAQSTELTRIIESFENKYRSYIYKREFQYLLIQKEWSERLSQDENIHDYFVRNSTIIAGTCTGFNSNQSVNNMKFEYVIIDEAAKATFTELLIPIVRAEKIILVGDQNQLPPILDTELLEKKKTEFSRSNMNIQTIYDGVFDKWYKQLPDDNRQFLSTQYRMHPCIGSMISEIFYESKIQNGLSEEELSHNLESYKDKAIVWISTSNFANRFEESVQLESSNYTYHNKLEARIIKEQLKCIDNDIVDINYDVGIITPYSAQKRLISQYTSDMEMKALKKISINSVDAFQGNQKDIIMYSTVRSSNIHSKIGFLKEEKRLNVAFSRAKRLLIIVGDIIYLNNTKIVGNRFPDIIQYMCQHPQCCSVIDYMEKR